MSTEWSALGVRKIVILILTSFIIFSCSNPETVVETWKKDFLIQTKPLKSFWNDSLLEKSWKIQWKDDIVLSSQATWRIGNILVKEWDKISLNQTIVQLNDTVANYWINLQKIWNLIEKNQINYDSTKVTLDKQIFDTEIALEKLKNSLQTLKTNSAIDIAQAKDNLTNTDYWLMDSQSSLQLEKINNSITKAELDYNNTLNSNQETINNFRNSIEKENLTQKIFLNDVISFWDKLLDITWLYKEDVKLFNDYLWTRDTTLKSNTKQLLNDLNQIKENEIETMNFDNVSEENIFEYISTIDSAYTLAGNFLNSLQKTLNNSIISLWTLTQPQIDAYLATTNSFQSQLNGNNSSFIAFKNSTSNFLKTYKNNESSIAKQLELLKKDKEIFLKNTDVWWNQSQNNLDKLIASSEENIKSLELQIKQTEETLKTAKESKELTLKSIKNSINDAYISKEIASKDYNKLSIKASIDWIVWDIFVDNWQDVSAWTPILSIISDKASQIELYFKENELEYLNVWENVYASIWGKTSTGTIYSISSVSDDSLNYKVLAIFNEKIQNLGWVIDVTIPIESNSILIPIKNVSLVWTNKWIINIFEDWKIVQKEVNLWKMYKDNIEFLGFLDWTEPSDNIMIITTDISNYDENKFNLLLEQ